MGRGPGYSSGPITQAPYYPQQPNYPPPSGPYNPPPVFNPQLPVGMPQQFYPWIPMYNFFLQQPRISYQWTNIWSSWQIYANRTGCGTYNFPVFWNTYFPTYWNYGPYVPFYQSMCTNFYSWMGADVVLPSTANSSYFWMNYSGAPLYDYNDGGWSW